jgi:uncharacterized membrane protein SirB2
MDALYGEIRLVHIAAVCASGGLFFLRGLLINVFGSPWGMAAPVRYLSYAIDTVLLAAALTLTTIIHQYPGLDGWLTMKVALLVLYIGLGSFGLKRARRRGARLALWIAALAVFAAIVTVARAHHPLGALAPLLT